MWMQYEAVSELTSPDDIAKTIPCGPDAARAAEAIAEYVEVGFDEIYIAQMRSRSRRRHPLPGRRGPAAPGHEDVRPQLAG